MVAKMKNEKNSLVLLSSKRTKADTRTRADEAFALPSFPEATPMFQTELPPQSCKEVAMEHHHGKVLENLKQTMLQHEAMFKEQVRELHRLYQVQRLLMAASKGKVINKSSDPASSNSSIVNSSDFLKPGGDRGALEAVSGSKISFMRKYQELASTPGQLTPPDHQMQVNTAQEGVQHLEETFPSKCHKKPARRRTFDLERPAEEYIDVDYGEEKSLEGDSPPTLTAALKVSHSTSAFINQSPGSGKDARWSPSMVVEREMVDTVCRGTFGKHAKVAEENGGDNHFLFQRPGSGEVSSFPLLPSKLDCPSNEALVFPTPVLSTKSLLGGLLGQKHEGQLEDKMASDMQRRRSAEHMERKVERQLSEPETDHRNIQENSTAPQWLLQGQAASIKNLPSPALTQNLGWHQPLPFFLQKQEDLDLPRKNSSISEETTGATVSQEQTKAGKTWSNNGTSCYPGQMLAIGMQGMPSSSLSPTGCTQVPYRIFPQVGESSSQSIPVLRDDKGAHIFPVFMSNHTSVPAVDMPAPDPETHAASMMFPLGFNARGIVHGPSSLPWFQVNGFSSPMQQQQVAKFKSGSPTLAGERSLPGDYKVEGAQSFGSASIFGSNLHGHFKVTDDTSYSIMHSLPMTARREVPPKETVFGNNTTITDVELTLGVCTNKVNKDPCCFGQPTVKQEQVDRLPFMGDGFERKPQTGKFQPSEMQSFLSEACTGDAKIKATHNGFEHGIETVKPGLFEYSTINVLQLGLSQKETDVAVTQGTVLISPDALNIKEALHEQRKDQCSLSKVIASQKQVQNFYLNAVEDPTEQHRVHDESEAVGECNNGNSGNERASIQHRKWTVSDTECAFSGGAADRPFDRVDAVGETIMPGRSSGVPSVTSCEIGETTPMSIWNRIDEVNLGCGEACQSHESECADYESENVVTPSSHMQNAAEICEQASVQVRNHCDEYMSPIMGDSLTVFNPDKENGVLRANSQDVGDDRESDNSRKHEDDVSDHSNQAAEILLSLTSGLSSVLEKEEKVTEDYAAHTKEMSLEWFANVIPREDESVISVGNKDATASFQVLETFEGVRSAFEQLGEATSRNSERSVEDRLNEVQSPKELDFFETVTLMLKASGLDTDEMNVQAIDKWQLEGECQSVTVHSGRPSRRGRVGKDFQREMLPSIASLSRQEITEDIQTLGGLVRSATEMVPKRSASCLPLKEENSCTPRGLDSVNHGGTKGLCMDLVAKSSRKDEMENRNGFLRISSWGELTRRRRMRRHRSHWSLLPLGIGLSSP